ncbi:adenine-specific DNA-methyltransferase [Pedococcus dokdonensis]|uniref:Adenine-specific DNA-methyltransferase n=1 Tax=Pedococcus dokdonensis TaxID=443156 RepID=A0A1H0U572_9MICO|nr:site-specific DNA-methyltransferase [Pedococcus dokdonensis]SDP61135.1 adenine-specific DNA-methyltransferase [Pedococcus dokdonensis]
MARNTSKGSTPVDAIKHTDKRTNIPTADAHEFVDPSIEEIRQVRYARDESLDPQLVWRGKYPAANHLEGYDGDLVTDAPPIYIQEKIDPRVLIENLRRTAARSEDEPELTLFDSFDGLAELDQVDFYKHDANWSNRMILGDSLQAMASLAEREQLRGKVQMVYIDPPYGIKFNSNWQVSTRSRDVTDGKLSDAAREAEQIKAFRDTWQLGIHSYLTYLRDRLLVARELLTDSGSCFVQIGDENVHLVRSLADEVFGAENFVTMVTVTKTSSSTSPYLGGTADYILWYGRDLTVMKYRPLWRLKAVGAEGAGSYGRVRIGDLTRTLTPEERRDPTLIPDDARLYTTSDLTSQAMGRAKGEGAASWFPIEVGGVAYTPSMQARWKTNELGMSRLLAAGRVEVVGKTPRYVRYFDDFPAFPYTEIWNDLGGATDKTYVVQTAPRIVERCMLMCSDPGDLVLDPTCGSGTTAAVAEQWGRRWITIDTSRVALALARQRVMGARHPWYLLADSRQGLDKEQSLTALALPRQEVSGDIRQGFVYDRVPHVMLRSIASNPEIKEAMTRGQIDAAIKRHSDFELLYDKPFEDPKKVRVAGPFTVESLSPHRSLAFSGGPATESRAETEAAKEAAAPNFEQSILDNLARAGIQNGRRQERITFASFETYAGEYIQAIGERAGDTEGDAPSRVAIAIGPQYGTVSPAYVKKAAREAINAEDVDLLCILGFAFDAQVTGVTEDDGVTVEASDEGFANVAGARKLGRIPVLMVRMNADLLMGEELKKTGAGNLFTVFGEPDIEIEDTADGYVVNLKGVDVYDPTTGEVRSNDTSRIALWMIDTDYNEESFFVRHCYFTGDTDPYKRLKTALKADIDVDAWDSLYQTTSRPFPKPETGKIAVKVINDYGDEVMKVFDV